MKCLTSSKGVCDNGAGWHRVILPLTVLNRAIWQQIGRSGGWLLQLKDMVLKDAIEERCAKDTRVAGDC